MNIRPYQSGNEAEILKLFSMSFDKEMPESFWRWRFLDNPLNQVFIYLAWDKRCLAAHYAVSPILVTILGTDYLTSISMTTMTHPEYRGLKLFPQLANQVYTQMTNSGHIMVWGFPNSRSHRIFIRDLKWTDLYEIPVMQLKLGQPQNRCLVDIITDDLFELDYNENSCLQGLIHAKKDRQYLRWRYTGHPINHYTNLIIARENKVSSFCVVKMYLNSLDIVDFQAQNELEGMKLLVQAQSFACLNNLQYINCWAPRHHFFHALCEKAGFLNKEPVTYSGFRQLCKTDLKQISNNYSDWYIQMGDSDVY